MGRKKRRVHPDLAIALRHEGLRSGPPVVVATGQGLVAQRILSIAREHGVPVHCDPGLAEALGQVEVGEAIPEELFEAVARILAYIYRVDSRMAGQ